MRYVSVIPGIIVLALALSRALTRFSLVQCPKWMRPFVAEKPPCAELPSERPRQRTGWVIALLVFSTVGFAAELTKIVPYVPTLSNIVLLVSWVSYGYSFAQRTLSDDPDGCNCSDRRRTPKVLSSIHAVFLCCRAGCRNGGHTKP